MKDSGGGTGAKKYLAHLLQDLESVTAYVEVLGLGVALACRRCRSISMNRYQYLRHVEVHCDFGRLPLPPDLDVIHHQFFP